MIVWRGRIQGLSGFEFEQLEAWKTAVMSVNRRIDKLRDARTEVHAEAMEKISVHPTLRAYYRGVRVEFNALFMGCLAVHSGLVAGSSGMSEDIVASVCGLGDGVPVLGYVLKGVSKLYSAKKSRDRKVGLGHVLELLDGGDMVEASYLSERIAREATVAQTSVLSGDLQTADSRSAWRRSYDEVKSTVRGFMAGRKESDVDRKVVHDVAKMLTALYNGEVDVSSADAAVAQLVQLVAGVDVRAGGTDAESSGESAARPGGRGGGARPGSFRLNRQEWEALQQKLADAEEERRVAEEERRVLKEQLSRSSEYSKEKDMQLQAASSKVDRLQSVMDEVFEIGSVGDGGTVKGAARTKDGVKITVEPGEDWKQRMQALAQAEQSSQERIEQLEASEEQRAAREQRKKR